MALVDFKNMDYHELWEKFIEVLYPNVCVLCGDVLCYGDRRGVCKHCEDEYPYIEGDLCSFCGKPLIDTSIDICYDCKKKDHYYTEGRSMWVYEDAVQESVHQFKYKDSIENGQLFAKELSRYYNGIKYWQVDLVVPVPLHKKRLRKRGYNQAGQVAKHFSRINRLELAKNDALHRIKETEPQKDLTDKKRLKNIEGAFKANKERVCGKNILLIDDIYTTGGSTINGCAKALKECGAGEIYYLAIAIGRGL